MSEEKQVNIEFEPEKHEYTVNGRKSKISVTALIDKQITKTEWGTIDPQILQRAANRGTDVHADLEHFVREATPPRTHECQNFQKYLQDHNWRIENQLCEFKLAIEHVVSQNNKIYSFILSGTADLICTLNGKRAIIDHKTTSVIHEESVRWQLSILDYMARKLSGSVINGFPFAYEPAEEFYVFHFDKQAKFTPVKVEKISDIEIERLLDAEAKNEEYYPTPVDILTPRQQASLLEIEQRIASLKLAQEALALQEQELKSQMLEAFQVHTDVKKLELPHLSISYCSPSVTTKKEVDFDLLQSKYPEAYKECVKETTTTSKPSVRITLSKEMKSLIEANNQTVQQLPAIPSQTNSRKNTKKRGFFA